MHDYTARKFAEKGEGKEVTTSIEGPLEPQQKDPGGGCSLLEETNIVCLHDFVTADCLEDDDEYMEIQGNVRDLCCGYGEVQDVRVPRPGEEDVGLIFVHFAGPAQAHAAVEGLSGKVLGGEEVHVTLYPSDPKGVSTLKQGLVEGEGDEDEDEERVVLPPLGGRLVWVHRFADSSEVVEDDEYEEVRNNVRSLCEPFGAIRSVTVLRGDSALGAVGDVIVEFEDEASAGAAVSGLCMRVVQGQRLNVTFYAPELFYGGGVSFSSQPASSQRWAVKVTGFDELATRQEVEALMEEVRWRCCGVGEVRLLRGGLLAVDLPELSTKDWPETEAYRIASALDRAVLNGYTLSARVEVSGLVTSSTPPQAPDGTTCFVCIHDFVEAEYLVDDDEFEEVRNNVHDLCSVFGPVVSLRIDRTGPEVGNVYVEYGTPARAMEAMEALNSRVVQGQRLHVTLSLSQGPPTTHDRKPTKDRTWGHSFLLSPHAASFVPGGQRTAPLPSPPPLPPPFTPALPPSPSPPPPAPTQVAPPTVTGEAKPSGPSKWRVPPKYAEAMAAPKLRGPRVGWGGGEDEEGPAAVPPPRPDACMCTPDMEELIKGLLKTLIYYQERIRQKDVNQAKKTRRMVFGLREVARGLRSGNIKLVVIAPDLERTPALDMEVDEIVTNGKDKGIPVLFGLSGRRLGRYLGKTVRVTVVGILNADGANEAFRELESKARDLIVRKTAELSSQGAGGESLNPHGGGGDWVI